MAQGHFRFSLETISRIAGSTQLPASNEELFALAEYIDAYDAKQVDDTALYMQARAKARAYIVQNLVADPRWDSGQSGAIHDMTHELREEILRKMEPKDPNA